MTDDSDALVVLGDSVPTGNATDATAWPDRLVEAGETTDETGETTDETGGTDHRLAGVPVVVRGDTGTTLASLADDAAAHLDAALAELAATDPRVVVLVHTGHNDAQLSGGAPRVPETEFRHAATVLDRALADHPAVARHGFVGLVPLLPDHGVPFADAQPTRSLTYDDALADSVTTHIPVARPVGDWHDQTADGVHPDGTGHAAVARAVGDLLG